MGYSHLLISLSVLVWQSSFSAVSARPAIGISACRCPLIMYIVAPNPVCGDGKEYEDECHARCAGARVILDGHCIKPAPSDPCICTMEHSPVCANGITYENKCLAKCAGFDQSSLGPCDTPQPCNCAQSDQPVCGTGKTYPNKCQAICDGVMLAKISTGACLDVNPACICPDNYEPVCYNGQTYSNACSANCAGAKDGFIKGDCRGQVNPVYSV